MAASFRSGIKILCECTKLQAWSSLRSRSVSDSPAAVTLKPTLLPFSTDRKQHQFINTPNTPATKENLSTTNRYFSDSKYSNATRCPVPDCAVNHPREKIMKLEAPYPSFSECTRDATLMPRPTERPRSFRSPNCIKENLGVSIDGCNPPPPKSLFYPDTKKWAHIRRKNASCGAPEGQCDPNYEPFMNSNISSSSPVMRCPSASSVYVKATKPVIGHKQFISSTRLFSDKAKEAKAKCKKMPEKLPPKIDYSSPVSCSNKKGKGEGGQCSSDVCKKVSTWRECPKPKAVNSYRCPVKVKTLAKRLKKQKVVKCKPTFRECPCPPPLPGPKCVEPEVEVVVVKPRCCKVMKVLKECPCPPTKSRCDVAKVEVKKKPRQRCVCGPAASVDKTVPCKKLNNAKQVDRKSPGGSAKKPSLGSCDPKK